MDKGLPGGEGIMSGSCRSRGKLLITGEYLILLGAGGLALPLQRGQELEWFTSAGEQMPDRVDLSDPGTDRQKPPGDGSSGSRSQKVSISGRPDQLSVSGLAESRVLYWSTIVNGSEWFSARFSIPGYSAIETTDPARAAFVGKVLASASGLSALPPPGGRAVSRVDFDMEWGLGSSSSLISNVAYMFDIDPFDLHFSVSEGSGYDIACARSDKPVLYRLGLSDGNRPLPEYRPAGFNPPFRDRLFFAYTGRKQDSAGSVSRFRSGVKVSDAEIREVSRISEELIAVQDPDGFTGLLREHDAVISSLLDEPPVSRGLYRDLPFYVKSLGAWGGDFVMIVWSGGVDELTELLKQKGVGVVFPYDRLIHD